MRRLIVVLIAVALLCRVGAAADWPQWRGPDRDGRSGEKNLLPAWPEGGPKQLWQAEGLGKGYSSVAVVGNRLYTIGAQNGDESLVAVNLKTRQIAWKAKLGKATGDGPNGTPTVADGLVYALGRSGDLVCAQAEDGKILWQKNLANDLGGKMMSGWGYSETPLVDGEKLLCTPGSDNSAIAALNRKTGEIIWQTALPSFGKKGAEGAGYSSIVISNGGGVRQYVQLLGRGVVGIAADGKFLWGYDKIASGTANIPTPVVAGDLVFAANGYGTGAALLKLAPGKAEGSVTATEVYFLPPDKFQNHHGGVVLVGDYIYGSHGQNGGTPTCIELATGTIVWKGENLGKGSGAVIYADSRLYFRWDDGTVALIDAAPEAFKVRGTFKQPAGDGAKWAHPAISNGKLYLRNGDSVFCYDIAAAGAKSTAKLLNISGEAAVRGSVSK